MGSAVRTESLGWNTAGPDLGRGMYRGSEYDAHGIDFSPHGPPGAYFNDDGFRHGAPTEHSFYQQERAALLAERALLEERALMAERALQEERMARVMAQAGGGPLDFVVRSRNSAQGRVDGGREREREGGEREGESWRQTDRHGQTDMDRERERE